MKKRLLGLLLALTLCLALLPGVALAATSVTNEQQLRDAVASGGEIQLANTITINSTLTIESGKTVTLDLNGHVLKMDGSGSAIAVNDGAVLTIKDSPSELTHKFIKEDGARYILDETNGTETIQGGVIIGGTGTVGKNNFTCGGCVYVKGSFTMDGGTITGGQATYGGGIYSTGKFVMNGGSIKGCSSSASGQYAAIYLQGGEMLANDGTIEGTGGLNGAVKTDAGKRGTTFSGYIKVYYLGTVEGGIFTGYIENWNGRITGGIFSGTVVRGPIEGGSFVVKFDLSGGTPAAQGGYNEQTIKYREKAIQPDAPSKIGYDLAGWYVGDSDTKWNFEEDTVTGPMTLKAKWTIKQYTVTFDPDGGSDVASITQDYNTTVGAPEAPTKYGYTFAGWYDGETKQEFPFTLTDNKTLKAKWTPIPVTPVEEPTTPWWAILPALDETQAFSFADVDRGDWFYNDVYSACEAGLMTGTGADTFSPYGGATRGMLVTVLARMSGVSTSGSPWYAAGQRWAMTNGVSDGTNMTGSITREQLVAMLYRYAQLCGADVSAGADTNILRYADAAELSGYAVPAMQWACGVGLVQGSGGKLSPKATANRAQAAAMLMRFCTLVR